MVRLSPFSSRTREPREHRTVASSTKVRFHNTRLLWAAPSTDVGSGARKEQPWTGSSNAAAVSTFTKTPLSRACARRGEGEDATRRCPHSARTSRRDDPDVCPRGPDDQRTRPRTHHAARCGAGAIPTSGHAPRVLGAAPLRRRIMPRKFALPRSPPGALSKARHDHGLGITQGPDRRALP
jgi:hypothetical protein